MDTCGPNRTERVRGETCFNRALGHADERCRRNQNNQADTCGCILSAGCALFACANKAEEAAGRQFLEFSLLAKAQQKRIQPAKETRQAWLQEGPPAYAH